MSPPDPSRLQLDAPAKINFGLRITGRRPDGYHLLESLFLPLALADRVELQTRQQLGIRLEVVGPDSAVPADERNLAWRAASAFFERSGVAPGLAIRLHKRVPSAAGLGGGSSDAAAVLRGLSRLHPGRLSGEELAGLALGLGADVPFFLDPRPAFVSGVGEVLEPFPDAPGLPLLLANPGIPLPTARVFDAFDASLTLAGADPNLPPPSHEELDGARGRSSARSEARARLDQLREMLAATAGEGAPGGPRSRAVNGRITNDLEPAAESLCAAVALLREEIQQAGALAVGLSGSGPTVYGVFARDEEAEAAARGLALAPPARSIATRTLGSSP